MPSSGNLASKIAATTPAPDADGVLRPRHLTTFEMTNYSVQQSDSGRRQVRFAASTDSGVSIIHETVSFSDTGPVEDVARACETTDERTAPTGDPFFEASDDDGADEEEGTVVARDSDVEFRQSAVAEVETIYDEAGSSSLAIHGHNPLSQRLPKMKTQRALENHDGAELGSSDGDSCGGTADTPPSAPPGAGTTTPSTTMNPMRAAVRDGANDSSRASF